MVHSKINCEASSLGVVSNVKMNAKRDHTTSFGVDSGDKQKKNKYPNKRSEKHCAYCRDTYNEIERAKTCLGRVGGKSCSNKVAIWVRCTGHNSI